LLARFELAFVLASFVVAAGMLVVVVT